MNKPNKNIELQLQSVCEALREGNAELLSVIDKVDEMNALDLELPFNPNELDRAFAQCQNAQRTLEKILGKVQTWS